MKRFSIDAAVVLVLVSVGCASRAERDRGRLPMANIVLESRHDTNVRGTLMFGDVATMVGRTVMANGDSGEHSALIGRLPDKASIDLDIFSGTTHKAVGTVVSHVHREVDVRRQVPRDLFDPVCYFIIEQDLSLRLVVMSPAEYDAMKDRHERPK